MLRSDALPGHATGLGLRRAHLRDLLQVPPGRLALLEAAPENWIRVGGPWAEAFAELASRHTVLLHGLSLSIGGSAPLDMALVEAIAAFMERHGIVHYSEHLSASSDRRGHFYDLLPLPFDAQAVAHVAERVRRVQDRLQRRIALENISYYAAPWPRMGELEFLLAVLDAADCDLLLDVNNVAVNAHNHGYDAAAFIRALPSERIRWLHVAGHHDDTPALKIDTHGSDVSAPVWDLLVETYRRHGPRPTILERDFSLPPLANLLEEMAHIDRCRKRADGH